MELVDVPDSKSGEDQTSCRFDPDHRHHKKDPFGSFLLHGFLYSREPKRRKPLLVRRLPSKYLFTPKMRINRHHNYNQNDVLALEALFDDEVPIVFPMRLGCMYYCF